MVAPITQYLQTPILNVWSCDKLAKLCMTPNFPAQLVPDVVNIQSFSPLLANTTHHTNLLGIEELNQVLHHLLVTKPQV